jgi:hypothetical protein
MTGFDTRVCSRPYSNPMMSTARYALAIPAPADLCDGDVAETCGTALVLVLDCVTIGEHIHVGLVILDITTQIAPIIAEAGDKQSGNCRLHLSVNE